MGFRARVSRYHDTPAAWKSVGSEEVRLAVVGRWVAVDRPVDVGPDTNSVALDFRVESDSDCGELWVDDLSLAPVGHPVTRGP